MTATKERKILLKSIDQMVEGILTDIVEEENCYRMIFESGEFIRMPRNNYTIPFDLYEGMHIRAEWKQEPGWDKKRFVLTSLENQEETNEDNVPF